MKGTKKPRTFVLIYVCGVCVSVYVCIIYIWVCGDRFCMAFVAGLFVLLLHSGCCTVGLHCCWHGIRGEFCDGLNLNWMCSPAYIFVYLLYDPCTLWIWQGGVEGCGRVSHPLTLGIGRKEVGWFPFSVGFSVGVLGWVFSLLVLLGCCCWCCLGAAADAACWRRRWGLWRTEKVGYDSNFFEKDNDEQWRRIIMTLSLLKDSSHSRGRQACGLAIGRPKIRLNLKKI